MRLNHLLLIAVLATSSCASITQQAEAFDACFVSTDSGWRLLSRLPINYQEIVNSVNSKSKPAGNSNLFWFENRTKELLLCQTDPVHMSERKTSDQRCGSQLWQFQRDGNTWQETIAPVIVCHR